MSLSSLVRLLTMASLRSWRSFLAGALAFALAGAVLASRLEIRSGFAELLPSQARSVHDAEALARRLGGDGTILVNVESIAGPQGLDGAKAVAARLGEEYRALGPEVVRSVDWNLREIERWYADHWPLFVDLGELERARDDLVAAIGQEKARVNPLMRIAGDAQEPATQTQTVSFPLLDPDRPDPRSRVLERFTRYPDGFIVHPDRSSVTIVVRPAGTGLGIAASRQLLRRVRAIADRHGRELESAHLRVGFAGTFPVAVAEYDSIVRDVISTLALVLGLVILSLMMFYREARPVLALGAAIVVALAVTFGVAQLAIGYLDTLTAFLGSVVAGNGINYGLVYLARVGQLRRRGVGLEPACHEGAQVAAHATLLASAGTSLAFGTLLLASNRGFRHFGLIGGAGMLACWLATFALLPAFLTLLEKIRPWRVRDAPSRQPRELLRVARWGLARPGAVVTLFGLAAVASLVAFLWRLPGATEQDLDHLTNDVTRSPELQREKARADAALGTSLGGAVALLPSRQAAEAYCEEIRRRVREQSRLQELIESCDTIASVVPSQQPEKLQVIRDIRERITERLLARLPPRQAQRARAIRAELAAQGPLDERAAPPTLLDRFRESDGTLGHHAFVRDRAGAALQLRPNLRDFVAGVSDVRIGGERYDATGETVLVAHLLADAEHDGPLTTGLAFLGMCALVLVSLRSWAVGGLLLVALATGVALMAGAATVLGLKINFFNFIVYPVTFGIAIDYGANVLARMRLRGDVLEALREVGPVVTLCSWTTVIGYGSLTLATNRALRSFGWYALCGELTAVATALIFLPAAAVLVHPWARAVRRGARAAAGRPLAAR